MKRTQKEKELDEALETVHRMIFEGNMYLWTARTLIALILIGFVFSAAIKLL